MTTFDPSKSTSFDLSKFNAFHAKITCVYARCMISGSRLPEHCDMFEALRYASQYLSRVFYYYIYRK